MDRANTSVDKAQIMAMAWAKRNGGDPAEVLGAAWLAMDSNQFLHGHAPCRQDEAIAEQMGTDLETTPADLSDEMHSIPHPDEALLERQLINRVHAILQTFPPRTERMMRLRFGLGRHEPMTFDEVSFDPGAGVCRGRAKQIIDKALRMMQFPTRAAAIREVAYGDLSTVLETKCKHENIQAAREWLAVNRAEPDQDANLRIRRERTKAETCIDRTVLARYRARFGNDWYLQSASALMAVGAANDEAGRAAA